MQELQEIRADIADVKDTLHSIDKTLVRQEMSLAEHIRRTAAAEGQLELLKQELTPIKKHVELMNMLAKGIVALGSVAAGILKFMGKI